MRRSGPPTQLQTSAGPATKCSLQADGEGMRRAEINDQVRHEPRQPRAGARAATP